MCSYVSSWRCQKRIGPVAIKAGKDAACDLDLENGGKSKAGSPNHFHKKSGGEPVEAGASNDKRSHCFPASSLN